MDTNDCRNTTDIARLANQQNTGAGAGGRLELEAVTEICKTKFLKKIYLFQNFDIVGK
jgi:hypothetical protein